MKRNTPRVNNPARLARLRHQTIKLRERVNRSTLAFVERSQARFTWWQRAFRVPMVADWAIFTKAKTLFSAFMALLGLAPGKKSSLVSSIVEGSLPQASRNMRRLQVEGLEQRQLLATDVSVIGNDLVIEDLTGSSNILSVGRSGANLVLSDANEQFATGIAGAVLSNGNKTVTVPASSLGVAGKIIVKTLGGSDSLTVDVSTDLGFNVDYQGGSGTSDSLTLAADTVTSVTHTFTNANDGSITIVDGVSRVISYTGLEPITDNLIATNRVFTFNGGAETIALTDATDANMTIDSTLSESVTFANPSGSLTINAGTGDDIVNITSVDAAFRGAVSINGDAGSDTVNWNAVATLGSASATGNVSLVTDVITVTNAISADTGRMIAVSLTSAGNVSLSGVNADVTTGGGAFTVNADSDANGTGTFTSDDAGSAVSTSGGAISIKAADVVLSGTLAGTSTLTLAPSTAGRTIGIGGGVGLFNLNDAELALLTDGFNSITIGDAAAGNIDINTATFTDSVVLNTSGRVNDATGADINVGAGNSLTINGNVAPGQSPGILNVTGNLQLNSVSSVYLADDFNDNSIDPAKWNVVTAGIPQAGASVIETGGRIQLTGRGHLNTAAALNPSAPGGLVITGTWQFGSGDDRMQILTRSNGTPSGSFGDTGQGIELFIVSNTLSIVGRGSATVTGGTAVTIPQGATAGDIFQFTLTDNGTNITGTITEVGVPANTATVTATSNFVSATNLVTFHNRESGRVSFLDDVVIRSAFSGYNVEIGGTTPGETATSHDQINMTGTGTIGSGVGLNLSNFVNNYTPSNGDQIVIVNNDASDAIIGTFVMGSGGTDSNGGQLANGDTITNFLGGSRSFRIFYNGGDGNDVVLVENSTPAVVYVDDSFTANLGQTIADADLGTTGSQPAIFGLTAFTTINAALAAVTSSGTIIVNGGTYAETVSLTGTRTLEVTGPNSAQTVTIDDLTTIAGTPVIIEGSSNLTVGDADSRTLAGVISGSGSFTKQGSGAYTLTASNLYTGATNINAGTLRTAATTSAPAGAVGIYTFDSVSGATVNNAGSAGAGKNGALVAGSAVVGGGRSGNAMSTSGGSGARMEIAGSGISLAGGNWTGAAWFNNLFTDGDWNALFRGSAADNQLIIEAGSNRLGVFDNALGFRPSGYDLVPASNSGWNHVAAVGSGTTTTFYRNGVFVGTADRKSVTDIFTVGAFAGGSQRFAQLIDDVYIYQSALTPTQIMTLYNSGAGTAANSIPDSSTVTIASGAFLDLNGSSEAIGTLAGAGTVTSGIAGSPTLTVGGGNGSGSFSGVIQNGAGTVSLAKTGTGTQTLSGSNLYTGATAGNNGTLVINGSVTSNVTVTTPGVLNGSGTVTGNVSGNGTFSPGNGPGIMTIVGNFTPSGTVSFEVNSAWTAAGTHFDQYLVTGLVNMAGSTVTFTNTADASAPAANSVIKLIDNNGTLDLTTAANTPVDGASITIGSRSFRLFYNGGDGNDVTVVWPNTAPTAANSSVTSNEDSTYIFSATDFNFSDTDSGDVLSSVTITTIESAGDLEWFDGSIWVDVSQDQEISKADIDANRLRFVPAANANGSSYATFSFKVKDTGGPVLSVDAYTLTINLSAINDVPVILNNTLSISEGATVVLGSSNLNATDPDNTPSQLTYTASSITAGQFEFAVNPGVAITSFTQDDINNSRVRFVHDGGEAAPSYSLVVSDGDLSSAASTVTIGTFTNVNDAPVISTNKLSVRERTTVVLGTSNISATDPDNTPNQLTYTASSITGGRFEFAVNPGVAITSFTQDDINNSRVRFVDYGDVAFPSYSLTVSDGADISGPSIVELTGQSMTFVVTSTADSGAGSLRQAIIDSNVGLGYDTITFNISGAGVRTISPTTVLPTITDAVVINGYTQPGSNANTLTTRNNAVILVELNGTFAGAGANGLTINSAGSLVTGLAINRFLGMGIHVHGAAAQNNTLQGNFVGLNASGTTAQANGSWGIFVDGSPNTTIGGATNDKRNLVSGNSQGGVAIVGSTAIGLAIEGNWIGTDITGSLDRGNALSGVYIGDAAGFGGVTSTGSPSQSVIRNNVISGNDNAGLWINSGADNTQVYGNLIGTNASGSDAIGNTDYGIHVQSNFNQIGGSTPAHRNVISGNLRGVSIGSGGTNNQVIGNYIGTDVSGLMPIQNSAFGVWISSVGNSVDGNTIANNRLGGLRLEGATSNNGTYINNTFSGNLGLAIDVGTVGRTLNDLPDVDGALNYPVVTSTQIVGSELIVEGTMEAGKTVEIYISAPTADGFGQGRQRLVSAIDNSLADENTASGQFLFRIPLGNGLSHGTPLTALTVGSTSEFSPISFAGEVGSSLAPQIKLSAASVSVTSGNAIGVDGSFYDPDSVSWDGTVDYGDGSAVQPLTLNSDNTFRLDHTYVTAGSFTVTVQIRDNTLISSTKTAAVIVQNAAPTASFNEFSLTTPANEGQTVTLTGQFEDTTGTHTATIDWGDGTTSEVTPTPTLHGQIVSLGDGKYAIQATHVYVDDSNSSNAASPSDVYRVVVTVRDETGASDSTPESLLRQEIRNVRPSALNVGFSSTSITEGQSITLSSLSFVDPGVQDVHTLKVNWGDGFESLIALPIGTRSLADLTPTQLANLTDLTHIYADDPSAGSDEYTITVEVADDDEPDSLNSVKASQPISVLNAQPSNVTFSLSSGPFAESSSVTIAAGSFVDAGNDKHRVFIDWGDGTAVVTADLGAGVLDFSQIPLEKRTHVYRNDPSGTNSSYTISVRVADNDDRETFGSSSSVVSIANVRPVLSDVTLDQSGPIEEGDTVTVTGRFTDVGQLDRHRVNVNWGDGTSSSANISVIPPISPTADIIYAFTATHIFGGNFNPANIVVSVEDGRYVEGVFEPDGGLDSASLSLVVRNVAPKAFIAPTLDSTRGATTFVAQVTDPGVMDTFTYAWSINGVPVTNDGDPAPDRLLLDATSFSSPPLIQVTITDEDGGTGSFDVQAIFGLDAPETLTINDPVTDSNGNTTISYTDVDNTSGANPVTVVGSFVALSRNILVMGFGGDDTLDASRLTADFATILNGGSQTDYLIGGAGADFFFAHSGNDTVEGRAGADTYLLKPNSILTVIDAIGDNKLDFSPANFADSTGITFDLSNINLTSLTSQTVSTSGSTEHIVRAMGSFSRLVGSQFGDTLTAASNSTVSGGAGNDQLKIADGVSGASLRGGADDDILNIDAGASVSNINFGGDEGIDSLTNLGSITGLAFNGGADDDQLLNVGTILGTLNFGGDDGVDALFNTGSIANLTFNGGADDDIFVNNGSAETTLSFNGDDDVLLSGTGSIGTLNFGGDDGVDIFANLGSITTLTFNGGADDDIFVNNGLDVMTLNFGGDDDVLLSGAGTIGTLNFGGDDGVDALLNTGNIDTLVFDGGADDDIFVNNGSVATNLSFNGDEDVLLAGAGTIGTLTFNGGADDDIFANLGDITSLAFNGGADDDIFVNNGNAVSTLSFGGDDDVLLAGAGTIGTLTFSGDDGVDALFNTGSITTLAFTGGADDDIFVNNGTVATTLSFNGDDDTLLTGAGSIETLTFGGDDGSDIFANLGSITTLTFNGGADDDIFVNSGTAVSSLNFGGDDDVLLSGAGTIGTLNFGGDDGLDTLINLGSVTALTFTGGADDDVLQNLGTVTGLTFGGGADDDLLLNTGSILGTLNFGGDDGVDILSNSGTINSLTFGGGADDDILQNAASADIGLLNFGGDDGIDTLTNSGSVTTLTFAGGADGDRLIIKSGAVVGALVFAGGGTLANQNAVVADDGADLLANFGTITTLTFNGGADDDILSNSGTIVTSLSFGGDDGADILANSGTIATLTFSGGADDDLLQNTGNVSTLTFDGGADDDVLQNTGNGIELLTFLGGADDDILINYGSNIASLVFNGGADDDILVSNGDSIGQLVFTGDDGIRVPGRTSNDTLIMRGTGSGAATSNIIFSGGYGDDSFENNANGFANITFVGGLDDDSLLNNAPGLTLLDFQGDEGDDVLVNHGTAIGSLQFTGGADDDVFINDGQSIASLTFAGGADDDLLINIGELITTLTFNGGADDDVLVNRGSQITLLDFNGGADDDILINDASLIETLSFTGDLGNDRLWNRKTGTLVNSIVFQGDDGIDTLVNDAAGIGTISFNGGADDDVLQNNAPIVTLTFSGGADDDLLINAGQVTLLAFNGGADDDILLNRSLNVETLTFTGDDGIDTLFNLGPVTSLTFNGGADDDVLQNTASVGALTFVGGADDDTLVNDGPAATLTFEGGADDDMLQNNATVFSLSFSGGADNDVLVNNGIGVTSLNFTGDDGADTLINNGSGISTIVFSGGADADSLRIEGRDIGNVAFYGGEGADSFTYNAFGRSTSSIRFDADAGNDFFAMIGAAATVEFDGGLGDDGILIAGDATMTLTGGDGDDLYRFTSNPLADINLTDIYGGLSDTSKDTLDFSSFRGGPLALDLRLINVFQPQGSGQLRIKLTDSMTIENVVGTPFDDTIYGNARSNYIGGADFAESFSGPVAAPRGVTQWVLLDFNTYTNTGIIDQVNGFADSGEYVYASQDRETIRQRVELVYRGPNVEAPWFDVRVVTDTASIPAALVSSGQYATIFFNRTPTSGRPGGLASEIDLGNVNLGGFAYTQVNGLLGGVVSNADTLEAALPEEDGDNKHGSRCNCSVCKGLLLDVAAGGAKPVATRDNFVLLSSKIAAHELGHLLGLRHQDAFGPIGSGLHDPPGPSGYKPTYTGPSGGFETFDHLIGSPASIGSNRFNDLNDLFFGEREAIKLAFAGSDPGATTRNEGTAPHGTALDAELITPVTLAVPNTLSRGVNQSKDFFVQVASVNGQISVDSSTGRSESDWYAFTGRGGELLNIDLFSNSLTRFSTGLNGEMTSDDFVDSIIRVWHMVAGQPQLVPYYGGVAVNDDTFEPTDSSIVDLILPADGTYYIEVDSFNRFGASSGDASNPVSPLNPANPNNILAYPEIVNRFTDSVNDTDTGRYQLIMYKFRKASSSDLVDNLKGFGGSDTIDGGLGDSYGLEYSLATTPTLNEGEAFSRTVTVVDRGASNWTGSTVDYGDASGIQTLNVSDTGVFTLSHTWADNGIYTVTVSIVNDVGQTLTRQLTVLVDNVAPSATLVAPSVATYGDAVLVELTSALDPSSTDTISGLRYAFATNLSSFTNVLYANASDTSALTLNDLPAGVHSIYGRIYDKDNAYSERSTTIIVQPRALTVTSDTMTKVYGDSDPALTYTYGTLVNNDTASVFTGSLARTAGENVGDYAISQGTVSAGSNYSIVFAGANLSVTPRSLNVSAETKSKVYGDNDPALTYTYGTLVNNDTASVFTGSLVRTAGENVGDYAISQGTVSAGSNYSIVFAGANLSVTPRNLTVSAETKSKVYGDNDPVLTYAYGTLVNNDTASVFTGSLARTAGENVNSYAINQGTLSAGSNYTIAYTGANLSITPAALSVTADAKTKNVGQADPPFTFQVSGLKFSDSAATVVTGSLTRIPGEIAAVYNILQGSLAVGSNYSLAYFGSTLTIIGATNNPPVVAISTPVDGFMNVASTFTFTADDPDAADQAGVFTYTINWGNGTSTTATGSRTRSITYTYPGVAADGSFVITASVTDPRGAVSVATTRAFIVGGWTLMADPLRPSDAVLVIVGSQGPDAIKVKTKDDDFYKVTIRDRDDDIRRRGTVHGDVRRILVFAHGGNDRVTIDDDVEFTTEIWGGAGNDDIKGGSGNDILMGESGNDNIWGGDGRDIVIGGTGADRLHGDSKDDILIAGFTAFETEFNQMAPPIHFASTTRLTFNEQRLALESILAEWVSARSYTDRRKNIRGEGTATRLNGTNYFKVDNNVAANNTVFDDASVDTLWGDSGSDWFFANLDNALGVRDDIKDRSNSESQEDIDRWW